MHLNIFLLLLGVLALQVVVEGVKRKSRIVRHHPLSIIDEVKAGVEGLCKDIEEIQKLANEIRRDSHVSCSVMNLHMEWLDQVGTVTEMIKSIRGEKVDEAAVVSLREKCREISEKSRTFQSVLRQAKENPHAEISEETCLAEKTSVDDLSKWIEAKSEAPLREFLKTKKGNSSEGGKGIKECEREAESSIAPSSEKFRLKFETERDEFKQEWMNAVEKHRAYRSGKPMKSLTSLAGDLTAEAYDLVLDSRLFGGCQ